MSAAATSVIAAINPTDVESIQDAILACGLYPYVDWQLQEFPPEHHDMCGKGIGLWQYPNQFAKYMHFVCNRLKTVRTYAEIGVAAGGTFIFTSEFLRRFCGLQQSYAVDIAPMGQICYMNDEHTPFKDILEKYITSTPDRVFIQGSSQKFVEHLQNRSGGDVERIDLLLIDGDHSYMGAKLDFDVLKSYASTIVFHDIANAKCPGVVRLWNEVKHLPEYDAYEFVDQYVSVGNTYLGIGALVPKQS